MGTTNCTRGEWRCGRRFARPVCGAACTV